MRRPERPEEEMISVGVPMVIKIVPADSTGKPVGRDPHSRFLRSAPRGTFRADASGVVADNGYCQATG
jgi:hypothetical protein